MINLLITIFLYIDIHSWFTNRVSNVLSYMSILLLYYCCITFSQHMPVPRPESVILLSQKILFFWLLTTNYCWPFFGFMSLINRISRNKCRVHPMFPPTIHHILLSYFCVANLAVFSPRLVHSSICRGFSLTDNSFSIITVWLGHNSCAPFSITYALVLLVCQSCYLC